MVEQLISFETAKLAYNKGYNIVSFPFYELPEEFKLNRGKYLHDGFSAPTQSLLQKWLRDTHNIHIDVTPESNHELITIIPYVYSYIIYKGVEIHFNDKFYDNYEEGLEAALQEALNLIDNVL